MSITTFDRIAVARPKVAAAPAGARRGFWGRFLDRMIEARQRKAIEQIRRHHRFALPREFADPFGKAEQRSERPLPFVR